MTAGIDMGAGPGSEVLGMDPQMLTVATLRRLYQQFPSPNLRVLLARAEQGL